MKTLHLFAGIGGGLLADLILGHDPIAAVEKNAYCCKILRQRAKEGWFPNLRVFEQDVKLWDSSEYVGKVDCIHAGFPCQDISCAGKGAGLDGEKSGLFFEVVRTVRTVGPRYVFLENVPAIVYRGLNRVLAELANVGYNAKWCVLPANAIGAPHVRARWWCLAEVADTELFTIEPGNNKRTKYFKERNSLRAFNCTGSDNKRGGTAWREQERRAESTSQKWWTTDPADQQGAIESGMGRVADGLPHRMDRVKAIGNAQLPLQAAMAWKILLEQKRY